MPLSILHEYNHPIEAVKWPVLKAAFNLHPQGKSFADAGIRTRNVSNPSTSVYHYNYSTPRTLPESPRTATKKYFTMLYIDQERLLPLKG